MTGTRSPSFRERSGIRDDGAVGVLRRVAPHATMHQSSVTLTGAFSA
jgi:hypothetical protein